MLRQINNSLMGGTTPLHNEVIAGNKYAVLNLIENGADIYAKDIAGKTPLDYANIPEIKKILIASAQTRIKTAEYRAELEFAEMKNSIKTEADKSKFLSGLFENPGLYLQAGLEATIEKLIEKLFNYDLAATPVVAPVIVTPEVSTSSTMPVQPEISIEQLANDLKARVHNGESINKIINSLDHYNISVDTKDMLIQFVFDDINNNNPVVAAPVPTPVSAITTLTPTHLLTSSEKVVYGSVLDRLHGGKENKDKIIDSLSSYPPIGEEKIIELINYIIDFNPSTELSGATHFHE